MEYDEIDQHVDRYFREHDPEEYKKRVEQELAAKPDFFKDEEEEKKPGCLKSAIELSLVIALLLIV